MVSSRCTHDILPMYSWPFQSRWLSYFSYLWSIHVSGSVSGFFGLKKIGMIEKTLLLNLHETEMNLKYRFLYFSLVNDPPCVDSCKNCCFFSNMCKKTYRIFQNVARFKAHQVSLPFAKILLIIVLYSCRPVQFPHPV